MKIYKSELESEHKLLKKYDEAKNSSIFFMEKLFKTFQVLRSNKMKSKILQRAGSFTKCTKQDVKTNIGQKLLVFFCMCCIYFGANVSGHYETSWHFYNETDCCLPNEKHTLDFISGFTCGRNYYRTLHVDEENGILYAGGMDNIYRLSLSNISTTDCEKDSLYLEAIDVAKCIISGKSEEYECRNHIRIIESIGENLLYICGTNAYNPKDLVIYKNLKHLPRHVHYAGVGVGLGRCDGSPNVRSASLWSKGLYSAVRADPVTSDPIIVRWDLSNGTEQGIPTYTRTIKHNTAWLDNPIFISLQSLGSNIYAFMRERVSCDTSHEYRDLRSTSDITHTHKEYTVLSHTNQGQTTRGHESRQGQNNRSQGHRNKIQGHTGHFSEGLSTSHQWRTSRVARVCGEDKGGPRDRRHWTTFAKAEISCSTPHYDQLESVYKIPGDDSHLYGAFTSVTGSIMAASLLCAYTSADVAFPFAAAFKDTSSTSGKAFGPLPEDRVPKPRPGICVQDGSRQATDASVNFMRLHPMMFESIKPKFDGPVFLQRDVIFTVLVVDKVNYTSHECFTIYYAGTNKGYIYKIVQWKSGNSTNIDSEQESVSFLQDVWRIFPDDEAIVSMVHSKKFTSLYVGSDKNIIQIRFNELCKERYDSCVRCSRDPYCGWNSLKDSCESYSKGHFQDVSDSSPDGCNKLIWPKKVLATFGQSVHFGVYANTPHIFKDATLSWYRRNKDGSTDLIQRSEKFITTSNKGLVVVGLTQKDNAVFECRQGKRIIAVYNLVIDSSRCIPPAQNGSYQRVYLDWCREFLKHKIAMKVWLTKRKQQCHRPQLDWTNRQSNEVPAY